MNGQPKTARPTDLDVRGVLWVAAIDRVPIEDRFAWVDEMVQRVEEINVRRVFGIRDLAQGEGE